MKINIWKNPGVFIIITLFSLIIGRTVEFLAHESGHYLVAKMMGISFQTDPVQIILTTPFLVQMYQGGLYGFSETFGYNQYIMAGPPLTAGLIAIGGLLMNGLIALICFWIFLTSRAIKYKGIMTVTLWILIFNLGALFSYIPLRVFSSVGDVGMFLSSLWIHPVIFLFLMLILMVIALFLYFTTILPLYCISIPVKSGVMRAVILVFSTIILIMYMIGPIIREFRISDIFSIQSLTQVFPVLVIGQCAFLMVLFLLGLMKMHTLPATRYLGIKKNTR